MTNVFIALRYDVVLKLCEIKKIKDFTFVKKVIVIDGYSLVICDCEDVDWMRLEIERVM